VPPEVYGAAPAVTLIGFLYAAVGHGGATGYIAVLTLFGFPLIEIAPAALLMNIAVSAVAFVRFRAAGRHRWALSLPFLLTSIPAAFLGGYLRPETRLLALVSAIALAVAAILLILRPNGSRSGFTLSPPLTMSLPTGGIIGYVSGMIGIGGGVFLTPLIVLAGWGAVAEAAATSALFILVNSLAGTAARLIGGTFETSVLMLLILPALAGGWIGAKWGSSRLSPVAMRRLLAAVLLIAVAKLAWQVTGS